MAIATVAVGAVVILVAAVTIARLITTHLLRIYRKDNLNHLILDSRIVTPTQQILHVHPLHRPTIQMQTQKARTQIRIQTQILIRVQTLTQTLALATTLTPLNLNSLRLVLMARNLTP